MTKLINLLPIRLDAVSREKLIAYFDNTWKLYDILFKTIIDENSFYLQPDPLRHPLIFYLGHTAAFYINKLKLAGLISKSIDPYYEKLFEQGVDPAKSDELTSSQDWPPLAAVWRYREKVYTFILDWLTTTPQLTNKIDMRSPLWAFVMALEHDRIHFETSSVLIRQLNVTFLAKPNAWQYAPIDAPVPNSKFVTIPKTIVELGKKEFTYYGWDNEFGKLIATVPEFHVAENLITNQEFLSFVIAGGYKDKSLWSTEGWQWRCATQTKYPKFWYKENNTYYYRAMFNILNMPLAWPVEVNFYEAEAYCAWLGKSYRLLNENEFAVLLKQAAVDNPCENFLNYNLQLQFGSPTPVGHFNHGAVNDIIGNVWQWLNNSFYPLPGFKEHPFYLNFSKPYYDQDHKMLRGGSWASTGTSASYEYRLWFRKHFFQHAGFRICYS